MCVRVCVCVLAYVSVLFIGKTILSLLNYLGICVKNSSQPSMHGPVYSLHQYACPYVLSTLDLQIR